MAANRKQASKIVTDMQLVSGKSMNGKISIKTPSLCLFIARSNSGKSHLMQSILYTLSRQDRFDWVYCFTTTVFNGEWSNILGKENVSDQFSIEWIENLLKKQAELISKGKQSRGCLIIDDFIGSVNMNIDTLTRLAISGRHYQLSIWISSQHFFKLSTVLRSNSTYLFILNNINEKMAKALHQEFPISKIPKWQDLQIFINKHTTNYGVALFDSSKGNPEIFVTRAPAKLPKFTLVPARKKKPKA